MSAVEQRIKVRDDDKGVEKMVSVARKEQSLDELVGVLNSDTCEICKEKSGFYLLNLDHVRQL